jgi:hypothetical protein
VGETNGLPPVRPRSPLVAGRRQTSSIQACICPNLSTKLREAAFKELLHSRRNPMRRNVSCRHAIMHS